MLKINFLKLSIKSLPKFPMVESDVLLWSKGSISRAVDSPLLDIYE